MLLSNPCKTCPIYSVCTSGYDAQRCPVSSLNAMHLLIKKVDPKQVFNRVEVDPYLLRTMPASNQS